MSHELARGLGVDPSVIEKAVAESAIQRPVGDYLTLEELQIWREVHECVKRLRAGRTAEPLSLDDEVDCALHVTGLDDRWREFVEHIIKRI